MKILKILETKKIQILILRKIRIIQVFKVYIKLKGILLLVFLNISILILVFLKDLIQKL